jgi:hemoglobin-like flavoprotein
MHDHQATFNLSYWRALHRQIDEVSFMDAFYARFFAQSNEIGELFSGTDLRVQKRMLMISLLHMAEYDPLAGANEVMIQLARRHCELGVKPRLYKVWLDSLLETVREYDPESSDAICEAWRYHLAPGIAFMSESASQ